MTNPVLAMFGETVKGARQGVPAPTDWEPWLAELFPQHVKHPFADRHKEFWDWCWGIDVDDSPRPFVGVWPRGGAKSTSAELGAAALGLRGRRRYALYVRETQEQADKSVGNIAALLESEAVARHYPDHADRMLSKFGSSLGWRRNRVRTAGGFTVDAIGLDTAARGIKVEEQRPDLIIFDDIDGKLDTAAATAKKIAIITTSLLPAGSANVAVMAIQNLIIPDGVFSRLVDGRADFLADRIVSGPFPAVIGLKTEKVEDPESGTLKDVITDGVASWEGQDLASCQTSINLFGLSAFLAECQHDVSARKEGVALKLADAHLVDMTDAQVRELVAMGRVFGGIDFGAWRFGVTVFAADRMGVITAIIEYFSQRQELSERAKDVHELCARYGIDRLVFRGDAANPTDIMELNAAWKRGWDDEDGERVTSRLRVSPVAMVNKERVTSVTRINELLSRMALRIRRTIGAGMRWREGMNAAKAGTETDGSRLLWEMKHWSYPIPQEGKAQVQDPDDNTADGADSIASMRYGIMSWLRPANEAEEAEPKAFAPETLAREAVASRKVLLKRKEKSGRRHLIDPQFGGMY